MSKHRAAILRRLPVASAILAVVMAVLLSSPIAGGEQASTDQASGYARWQHGPSQDATFFPIAVWLQRMFPVWRIAWRARKSLSLNGFCDAPGASA